MRYAERPGETLNADICFVPALHVAEERLPAVSGSSGHLILCHRAKGGNRPPWPGQVFGEAELDYGDAMQQYIAATRDRLEHPHTKRALHREGPSPWRAENERQAQRYQLRQTWKAEDQAWQTAKATHRQTQQAFRALSRAERQQHRAAHAAEWQHWQTVRQARTQQRELRQQATAEWHARNQAAQPAALAALEREWIAILALTDNCTRQCVGLPLFRNGVHLSSRQLVEALGGLLPPELAYLISDQGGQFRSQALADLASTAGFIHVPVYRHRPQSNGVAERFILTLKQGLEDKTWNGSEELAVWLARFEPDYNNRPHQGLAIPGLSPNEFANRIWLM